MNNVLHLSLPPGITPQVTTYDLPANSRYRLPFARPERVYCPSASLLTQTFTGNDYQLGLISFSVQSTTPVQLQLSVPVIAFALLIAGSLPLAPVQGDELLTRNTFSAFYLPAASLTRPFAPGEFTLLYVVPPPDLLPGLAAEHPELAQLTTRLAQQHPQLYRTARYALPAYLPRIIRQLEKCNKKGAALDLVLRSYVLKLLAYCHQCMSEKKAGIQYLTNAGRALAVKEYILANLANPQLGRMKQLTQQFYITPKTLNREFKKLVSNTVPGFIRDERLNLAHHLLTHTGKQVQEAALEAGYDYLSHFSREFKRKFGYPPVALRKKPGTR